MRVGKRYFALRAIATIFVVLAFLALAGGVVVAGLAMAGGASPALRRELGPAAGLGGVGLGLALLVYTLLVFLLLMAYGQLLQLLVDVEQNTREVAMALRGVVLTAAPVPSAAAEAAPPSPPPPPAPPPVRGETPPSEG